MAAKAKIRRIGAPGDGRKKALLKIACWAGLAVVAVGGLWLGARALRDYAGGLDRFRINMGKVERKGPSWQGPRIEHDLHRIEVSEDGTSIFDPGLTKRLFARYEACPWVKKVHYVRKQFPNSVAIRVDLRKPLAMTEVPGDPPHVMVDSDGTRLPDEGYVAARHKRVLPILTGIGERAPPVGGTFTSARFKAAARMARELANWSVFAAIGVTAVDVSNYELKRDPLAGRVVLLTERRTRIQWGSAPGEEKFAEGEAKVEKKVMMLAALKKKMNRLEWVDVRFPYRKGAYVKERGALAPPPPRRRP